ncbi:MAG: hypothetical protein M3R32_03435 [Chloroflexota bacterium]|nr:hypothetical protein [Chloroflexota bacterium]
MSTSLPSLPADPERSRAMAAAMKAAWALQSWYQDLELRNGAPVVQVVDKGGHWSAVVLFRSSMPEPAADRICRHIAAIAPRGIHEVIVAADGSQIAQCLVIAARPSTRRSPE